MMVMMIALHGSSARPCDVTPGAVKVSASWPTACSLGMTDAWKEGWRLGGIVGVWLARYVARHQKVPGS